MPFALPVTAVLSPPAAISSLTVLLPASDRLLNYPNKQKAPGEFISPGAFAIAPNCIKREARQKLNDPLQKEGLLRKDNPPIPVGIETGGLESLQRFETHWKVQKIRKFFSDVPRRFRRRGFNKSQAEKAKDKLKRRSCSNTNRLCMPKWPCLIVFRSKAIFGGTGSFIRKGLRW